ncbi:MAG: hypothetical protein M0Z77_01390 [Thermoplasmatales archaeon]|nr:hypothetical protein [Candidatus Thermoplasmatota archaeon]MCL6002848.1 hypothetical protein [Candidatus Thermoplasmatota archaeon]MDA8054290.1 hypothetical protein [Thermoplasmatales archaeon]
MKEDVIEKYPFLRRGLIQYFGEGISLRAFLEENEYYLQKSADLLYKIMNGEEAAFPTSGEERVKNYIITKIILTYIRDYFISARYAIRERKALYDTLEKESDVRNLKSVSHELNVEIDRQDDRYLISIPSFLKNAVVFNDRELKLCNQELQEGYVVASKHVLSKIIREAFYRKYMQEVMEVVEFPSDVDRILGPIVSEVIAKGREIRQERANLGPLNEKSFPPCLAEIIDQMKKGANVSHAGRFFLVTFLHRIGLPNDEILKYFGEVPDFAEKITKYQIEHITGTGRGREYSVPSCQTLGSLGLCYKERDPLCSSGKISHPLSFYRTRNLGNRSVSKPGPVNRVDKSSDP